MKYRTFPTLTKVVGVLGLVGMAYGADYDFSLMIRSTLPNGTTPVQNGQISVENLTAGFGPMVQNYDGNGMATFIISGIDDVNTTIDYKVSAIANGLKFNIPTNKNMEIKRYNSKGQEVPIQIAKKDGIEITANNLPSGVYFDVIQFEGESPFVVRSVQNEGKVVGIHQGEYKAVVPNNETKESNSKGLDTWRIISTPFDTGNFMPDTLYVYKDPATLSSTEFWQNTCDAVPNVKKADIYVYDVVNSSKESIEDKVSTGINGTYNILKWNGTSFDVMQTVPFENGFGNIEVDLNNFDGTGFYVGLDVPGFVETQGYDNLILYVVEGDRANYGDDQVTGKTGAKGLRVGLIPDFNTIQVPDTIAGEYFDLADAKQEQVDLGRSEWTTQEYTPQIFSENRDHSVSSALLTGTPVNYHFDGTYFDAEQVNLGKSLLVELAMLKLGKTREEVTSAPGGYGGLYNYLEVKPVDGTPFVNVVEGSNLSHYTYDNTANYIAPGWESWEFLNSGWIETFIRLGNLQGFNKEVSRVDEDNVVSYNCVMNASGGDPTKMWRFSNFINNELDKKYLLNDFDKMELKQIRYLGKYK